VPKRVAEGDSNDIQETRVDMANVRALSLPAATAASSSAAYCDPPVDIDSDSSSLSADSTEGDVDSADNASDDDTVVPAAPLLADEIIRAFASTLSLPPSRQPTANDVCGNDTPWESAKATPPGSASEKEGEMPRSGGSPMETHDASRPRPGIVVSAPGVPAAEELRASRPRQGPEFSKAGSPLFQLQRSSEPVVPDRVLNFLKPVRP
jgi:hypothetical protein